MTKRFQRDPGYALDLVDRPAGEVTGTVLIDNKVNDVAIPELTLEQRHSMSLHIVERMRSPHDARTLMSILGVELACALEDEPALDGKPIA